MSFALRATDIAIIDVLRRNCCRAFKVASAVRFRDPVSFLAVLVALFDVGSLDLHLFDFVSLSVDGGWTFLHRLPLRRFRPKTQNKSSQPTSTALRVGGHLRRIGVGVSCHCLVSVMVAGLWRSLLKFSRQSQPLADTVRSQWLQSCPHKRETHCEFPE